MQIIWQRTRLKTVARIIALQVINQLIPVYYKINLVGL